MSNWTNTDFAYSTKAKRRRGSPPKRQCKVCEEWRSPRSFCKGHVGCLGCRRQKNPKRGSYTPSGKMTDSERERYAAQAEAERARAIIADARAAQGLPVVHGCTPLWRPALLSDRGLHAQRIQPHIG
jgi:hypothetical protein